MKLTLVFSILSRAACVDATQTEGVRRLMIPSYDILNNDDGVIINFPSSLLLSGATTSGSSSEDTQFRCQRGSSDEHYVGTADGAEQTLNVLLRDDQIVIGSIVDEKDGNVYKLSTNASGDLEATVTHTSEFPPELNPEELEIVDGKYNPPVRHLREQTSGNFRERGLQNNCPLHVVDVLVPWTKEAECIESNLPTDCFRSPATEQKIRDLIDLAIAETNTAYTNSGVRVNGEFAKLNLAHAYYEPVIKESLGFSGMLSFIAGSSVIDAKRTEYGADVVSAITAETQYCGMAYMGPNKSSMFSVTSTDCATGYYSFGHEIGHNMGANHDKGTTNTCGTSSYSYGFRDPAGGFRSILAYDCQTGQCDANSSNWCSRVQRFSNDEFLYNGLPIGNAQTDNARQHSDVFATVSAYYQCKSRSTPRPSNLPTHFPLPSSSDWNIKTIYLGCYKDDWDRALPENMGSNVPFETCARLCSGFKYFNRQYNEECWCGDGNYAKHGVADGCECDAENIGSWKSCTYEIVKTLSPTESPTTVPTSSDSPSAHPGTRFPTELPTAVPTSSNGPSPSTPNKPPTESPTAVPTSSDSPTKSPTKFPTRYPTESPTESPTEHPSESPSSGVVCRDNDKNQCEKLPEKCVWNKGKKNIKGCDLKKNKYDRDCTTTNESLCNDYCEWNGGMCRHKCDTEKKKECKNATNSKNKKICKTTKEKNPDYKTCLDKPIET